ncbi:MAG: hypothetical protein OEU36_14720, partial [Gammaproteobacteria bacterium]|nr:hypothetical protein [Gammaproteobacteria bacterium]
WYTISSPVGAVSCCGVDIVEPLTSPQGEPTMMMGFVGTPLGVHPSIQRKPTRNALDAVGEADLLSKRPHE